MYLLHAYPLIIIKKILNFELFTIAVGSDVLENKDVIYRTIRRLVYRKSNFIFAVSHELENAIREEGRLNTLVIPTGVDPNFLKLLNSREELRRKWGFREDDFIILTLSLLVKVKCIDDLIRAISILKKKRKEKEDYHENNVDLRY
jgi:glycosyltransferase involved in cell wall biosynthesis